MAPGDPHFGPVDGLNQLVRRRYMALAYPTVEDLLELEQTVLAIQADLDEIASQPAPGGEPGAGGSGPTATSIVGSPSSGWLR